MAVILDGNKREAELFGLIQLLDVVGRMFLM